MDLETFRVLHGLLVLALALTAVGAWTRLSAHSAWIVYFVYFGTILGFFKSPDSNYVYHSKNIVVFVLFILAVAPGVAHWGIDGFRRRGSTWSYAPADTPLISDWPRQLIKLTLALAYFGSGYCKLATNLLWADGYTLQGYLMSKYLLIGPANELGHSLAQHYWLCLLLGIGTLVLELTFVLVVFFPRLTWYYVASGLAFHTLVYQTMQISFFPYFGYAYLIFLDWGTLTRLTTPFRRRNRFRSTPDDSPTAVPTPPARALLGATPPAKFAIVGMSGVLLLCIVGRVESWPFTDYCIFQHRFHPGLVRVFRFATVSANGDQTWLARSRHPISPVAINTRCQRGDDVMRSRILLEVSRHVQRQTDLSAQAVVLVERTLEFDPGTHRLRTVDRAVLQTNLKSPADHAPPLLEAAIDEEQVLR